MFQFFPGNHSVIESLYGWPCVPKSAVDGEPMFFSQFFPDTNSSNVWILEAILVSFC